VLKNSLVKLTKGLAVDIPLRRDMRIQKPEFRRTFTVNPGSSRQWTGGLTVNAFYEHHQDSIRFHYRCFDRILLNAVIPSFLLPQRALGFSASTATCSRSPRRC